LYFPHSLGFDRGVFGRSLSHDDRGSKSECLWECFLLGDFSERRHWGIFSLKDCLQGVYDLHKGSRGFFHPVPDFQARGLLPVSHHQNKDVWQYPNWRGDISFDFLYPHTRGSL
jgi:hypothetical protein